MFKQQMIEAALNMDLPELTPEQEAMIVKLFKNDKSITPIELITCLKLNPIKENYKLFVSQLKISDLYSVGIVIYAFNLVLCANTKDIDNVATPIRTSKYGELVASLREEYNTFDFDAACDRIDNWCLHNKKDLSAIFLEAKDNILNSKAIIEISALMFLLKYNL